MDTTVIILLVLGAVAGNVVLVWAIRKGGQRDAAIAAFAQGQGWTHDKTTERFASVVTIADPKDGWRLETRTLHSRSNEGSGGAKTRTTWTAPDLSIPEGTAVYGPPLPAKTVQVMGKFMGEDGGLAGFLIKAFTRKLGTDVDGLTVIEGRDDPATLLATPGEEHVFDALIGAEELFRLNDFGSNVAEAPFLVRNQDGLVLRLNRRLKTPEELAAFVDAGQSLADRLRSH